jgi:hypothetical protein
MDYPAGFLGMRGTGDFTVTGQRPESWREMILRLYPNGAAPLTAIMSKLSSEKTSDPIFHWFQKILPKQRATVTGIYTDVLSTAYVNGGVAGDTLYVKMSAADVAQFVAGHQILLRNASRLSADVNALVTAVTVNGASSYLTVSLLEIDNNGAAGAAALATADVAYVIGTAHPEGGLAPSSLMYDPSEYSNYTQIFKSALEHTRTAMRTRLRTGDQVAEARREALELHSIEMEKAFIFGVKRATTGGTGVGAGKPLRTTGGLKSFLSSNVFDFQHDVADVLPWTVGGEDYLDNALEQIFRYGSGEKLCLCGSGCIQGINRLAKAKGQFQLSEKTQSYGIKVLQWVTAFGVLNLKSHPLFTYEATLRNSMLACEPRFLKFRYIDDTMYKPDVQAPDLDGELSQYITEGGLELHFEQSHGWFDGIGLDRANV